MRDDSSSISKLKTIMAEFVNERNWGSYHHPKELAIALSIESSELLELFLFKERTLKEIHENEDLMGSLGEEIADIFAYLLSLLNSLKLDLTTIFLQKMEKNRKKYPTSEFNGNY
jgi:NTP pyrophosphatase (non-canonical NTP hydrolase)